MRRDAKSDAKPKLIQVVQVRRRKVVGLEDDTAWRDFLARATGLRSLREMTGPQLGQVLDALTAAGAPDRPVQAGRRRPRFAASAQMSMIRGLWLELADAGKVRDRSEAALARYIRRQTGQEMGHLAPADANRVIEGLKAWVKRGGHVAA
jgi:phage gp16-like protein